MFAVLQILGIILAVAATATAVFSLHKLVKAGRLAFGDPDRLMLTLVAYMWVCGSMVLWTFKNGISVYETVSMRAELQDCKSALGEESEP